MTNFTTIEELNVRRRPENPRIICIRMSLVMIRSAKMDHWELTRGVIRPYSCKWVCMVRDPDDSTSCNDSRRVTKKRLNEIRVVESRLMMA